jgi:hypothetical protein
MRMYYDITKIMLDGREFIIALDAASTELTEAGRHRRHARKPAASASAAVAKKATFSRRGRRDGQVGRQ